MNVLILMAGNSNDFEKNGYNYPKYFLEIQNKPIIQRIIETLSKITDNIFCIIKKEDQEKYYLKDALKILHPNAQVIELPKETKGALCSALFAIDKINNDDELLICNGDQFIKSDISKAIVDFKK